MTFSPDADTILIEPSEEGLRLDKILALRFSQIRSRTYFQYLIENGCVLVNGIPAKKRIKPKAGDEIEIEFQLTPELDLTPEPIPLDIVYEDEHLIVINKPAGMVVHPAVGNWHGTFVNALLYHCRENFQNIQKADKSDQTTLRPGIVHRLDKETSGLLMAAKTSLAQQRLVEMFAQKQIYKEYLAICVGNPGQKEIRKPMGRHPVHRKLMAVREEGGKEALTICKTVAYNARLSLVELVLATGRTHQIRVHLAHVGTPVLGDSLYGRETVNRQYQAARQMLHARILRFSHPVTGEKLEFEAPLPEDMQQLAAKIKSP
jgi:23S rRNA pseudouridine1911/1915/1917 synthase